MKELIKFELFGHKIEVSFPNVMQMMEIDGLKQTFSNGRHEQMRRSTDPSQRYSLDLIDAMSHFSVLSTEFKKLVDLKDIDNMPLNEAAQLVKVYRKYYKPKFDALMNEINASLEEVLKDDADTQ